MRVEAAFIGIDWSGAKGPRQQGIQLACALPGNAAPHRIICSDHEKWGRDAVLAWLLGIADGSVRLAGATKTNTPVIVGIDFAFAHPFIDENSYYPGLDQPQTAPQLWQLIDHVCQDDPHLYGGQMFAAPPWADYYLSPHNHKAPLYASRRRQTESAARAAGRSPSPTFKAIGADNVATGSMAGMRLLHRLKGALGNRIAIWPFDPVTPDSWGQLSLILVEIFPSLYFHAAGFNPARNAAGEAAFMSAALAAYQSDGVPPDFNPQGSDADEADAMISAAAMRYLLQNSNGHSLACFAVPPEGICAAKSEGWIFGVGQI
ncbi:hypothetical protein N9W44_06675 [Alphaproteobacteria bacterium]|jgi:hypothetical protein|nr:hypothetical protein [Alphaproteobacteria bacterium]